MAEIKSVGASAGVMGTGSQVLAASTENKSVNEASSFQKALEKAQSDKDDTALMKVCEDFESLFINMMFKSMRTASETDDSEDGLVEKSFGRGIFEDMRDEEISKKAAAAGGIGIAKVMYNQMKKYGQAVDLTDTSSIDTKK